MSREDVARLALLRTQFGGDVAKRKVALLGELAERRIATAGVLKTYHELLLFMSAYADDAAVLAKAEAELGRMARECAALCARASFDESMMNSGISGSAVETSFSIDLLAWLVERFGGDAEVCWEGDALSAESEAVFSWLASSVETDALVGSDISTREWVNASRDKATTALEWMVKQLKRVQCSPALLDELFEAAELQVRWRLRSPLASRTLTRLEGAKVFGHSGGLRKHVDVRAELDRPLPRGGGAVDGKAARAAIDAARATLAVRMRETEPVTYANEDEVFVHHLERGVSVAVIGMQPGRRLPIESFFGYVAAKNGVPVAYGGAWMFLHKAAIGINVFDTFRGGESAFVFAQVMRVYRQMFDVCRFFVEPYQFGAGNREAIASGAFWFYYRLGFRPTDAKLAALAEGEWQRMRENRRHRSPSAVLRKLATGELAMDLTEAGHVRRAGGAMMVRLQDVAMGVSRRIGEEFAGDRIAAERHSLRRMRELTGVKLGSRKGWTEGERSAFGRLSVLMNALPGVEGWSKSELRSLGELMRAKGGKREAEYAKGVREHRSLGRALAELAGREEAE